MNKILRTKTLLCALLLWLSGTVLVSAQTLPFTLDNGGGTFRLGIVVGEQSKWVEQCAIKKAGNTYTVKDKLLGKGSLQLTVLKLSDTQGFIVEAVGSLLPEGTQLCWAFGECNGLDNVFSTEGNAFTTYYGKSMALRTTIGVTPLDTELRLSNGHQKETPLQLYRSGKKTDLPLIASLNACPDQEKLYYCIYKQNPKADYNYYMLPELFKKESK